MENVEGKDGTNQSRGSNGTNTNSKVFYPDYKDCLNCNHLLNVRLQEQLERFEKLPTSENKLADMKALRLETDLRLAVFFQDQLRTMDILIAYEKEVLEIGNELKDKKRLRKEAEIRANEVMNNTIKAGVPRLVVDCEEIELALLCKKFFIETFNKKKHPIFEGYNKVLATWICNSFRLKSGHEINYITIVNGLSKTDNIDPKD